VAPAPAEPRPARPVGSLLPPRHRRPRLAGGPDAGGEGGGGGAGVRAVGVGRGGGGGGGGVGCGVQGRRREQPPVADGLGVPARLRVEDALGEAELSVGGVVGPGGGGRAAAEGDGVRGPAGAVAEAEEGGAHGGGGARGRGGAAGVVGVERRGGEVEEGGEAVDAAGAGGGRVEDDGGLAGRGARRGEANGGLGRGGGAASRQGMAAVNHADRRLLDEGRSIVLGQRGGVSHPRGGGKGARPARASADGRAAARARFGFPGWRHPSRKGVSSSVCARDLPPLPLLCAGRSLAVCARLGRAWEPAVRADAPTRNAPRRSGSQAPTRGSVIFPSPL